MLCRGMPESFEMMMMCGWPRCLIVVLCGGGVLLVERQSVLCGPECRLGGRVRAISSVDVLELRATCGPSLHVWLRRVLFVWPGVAEREEVESQPHVEGKHALDTGADTVVADTVLLPPQLPPLLVCLLGPWRARAARIPVRSN